MEAVLPEAVSTDAEGYKSVRYNELIPLLIESLKELDKKVEDQSRLVAQQQEEIARLTKSNLAAQQQLAEFGRSKGPTQRLGALDAVARVPGPITH